ncbi:hypothetical protein HDU76_003914 [Blyttiomyces sp. JEL0837]|nr:hypothetical protein HDU76_003914 [Blyttiomyces sp. JEL0837]
MPANSTVLTVTKKTTIPSSTTLIITTLTSLLLYIHLRNRRSSIKSLPQPPPYPLLGHLPFNLFHKNTRLERITANAEKYGPTWTISLPNFMGIKAVVITVDPVIVEYVLKGNFENFEKSPIFKSVMEPLLGKGIFNSDGDIVEQRKISSHIFTARNFREVMNTIFLEDIDLLIKVLQKAASTNQVLDLHQLLHAFTLDSFAKIGFGTSLNCLQTPTSQLPFATAFDRVVHLLTLSTLNPLHKFTNYITGKQKEIDDLIKVIDEFAYERIRERREGKREVDGGMKDLLDLFMESGSDREGGLSDKELRDMVLNMILAGRDTTAQALSWAFYELSKHPDVVERIRQETRLVTDNGENLLTTSDVPQMKYTTAVFYEVLRLYPSVPLEGKVCKNPDTLPGNIQIPSRTVVQWPIYAMGRMESLWGPTAKQFIPDRFLSIDQTNDNVSLKRENQFKYPVFNAGPRTCLGQQMATVEGVLVLSRVLEKFDFVVVEGQNVRYDVSLTLKMKDGVMVRVGERK